MKDYLNILIEKVKAPGFVKSLVDHNRGLFFSLLIVSLFALPLVGCQFKTIDPLKPTTAAGKPNYVTRDQLDAEASVKARDLAAQQVKLQQELSIQVADLQKQAGDTADQLKPAYADLDKKEAAAAGILNTIQGLISTYAPAPYSAIGGVALGVLSMGLGLDNQRKSRLLAAATSAQPTGTPADPLHAVIEPPALTPPKAA